MNVQTIIDKLSLQVRDLQENFNSLANSKSMNILGKQFCRMLSGTLLTTNVNLLKKEKKGGKWKEIYFSKSDCVSSTKHLSENDFLDMKFLDKGKILVAVTVPLVDGTYFGILIGKKLDKQTYSEFDKIALQMFILLLDHAYQSFINQKREKELNFQLNHRILQLNTLIDTGIEISKLKKSTTLLDLTIERATALTNASKGRLKIFNNEKLVSEIIFPKGIKKKNFERYKSRLSTEVTFDPFKYELTLFDKESRKGLIDFDNTDEVLLNAFARQVYTAMENEFLHKEALEKESIQKELSVAGAIQKKLLPEQMPKIPGYDVAGINIPSKEVGGDYYQCVPLDDGRIALIIGDVAGKGVSAGLLVSTLDACLKAYLDMNIPLSEMAVKINKIIFKTSPIDKFITFFIAVLNPKSGELDVINAGHNPILILRKNGTLDKINAGGVAFGMFDMGLPFEGEKLKINKGEKLLLYTDGITEAMNQNEEEYSDERLENFFIKKKPVKAETFIKNIVADVKKHTGNTPQSDDITALYLIRK